MHRRRLVTEETGTSNLLLGGVSARFLTDRLVTQDLRLQGITAAAAVKKYPTRPGTTVFAAVPPYRQHLTNPL
jgi:hypothetical protein